MLMFLYPMGIGNMFYNMFVLNGKFRFVGQKRDLVRKTDPMMCTYYEVIKAPIWNISEEAIRHLSL